MKRKTEIFNFDNGRGDILSGRMELPRDAEPTHFGIFANCFTCAKEFFAPTRTSRALAERGIAMLRFDFTGLGESEGTFSDTNFTTKIQDICAAAKAIKEKYGHDVSLVIGHSLGGAAAIASTAHLPSAKAVATIGAPRDPDHVMRHFREKEQVLERDGQIEIDVAGRKYILKQHFMDDLSMHHVAKDTADFEGGVFVFHAPEDDMVVFENAKIIYERANEPKFFYEMPGAGHMFEDPVRIGEIADALTNFLTKK